MSRTTHVPNARRLDPPAVVIDMESDVSMLFCRGECGMFIVDRPGRAVGYTCPDCHPIKEEDE